MSQGNRKWEKGIENELAVIYEAHEKKKEEGEKDEGGGGDVTASVMKCRGAGTWKKKKVTSAAFHGAYRGPAQKRNKTSNLATGEKKRPREEYAERLGMKLT